MRLPRRAFLQIPSAVHNIGHDHRANQSIVRRAIFSSNECGIFLGPLRQLRLPVSRPRNFLPLYYSYGSTCLCVPSTGEGYPTSLTPVLCYGRESCIETRTSGLDAPMSDLCSVRIITEEKPGPFAIYASLQTYPTSILFVNNITRDDDRAGLGRLAVPGGPGNAVGAQPPRAKCTSKDV